MRRRSLTIFTIVALSLGLAATFAVPAMAQEDFPRMTKEELKEMLGSPDLVIVDVRVGKDWKASEFKVKGAVREDPGNVDPAAGKYAKDKTLVLYCA